MFSARCSFAFCLERESRGKEKGEHFVSSRANPDSWRPVKNTVEVFFRVGVGVEGRTATVVNGGSLVC